MALNGVETLAGQIRGIPLELSTRQIYKITAEHRNFKCSVDIVFDNINSRTPTNFRRATPVADVDVDREILPMSSIC